VEWHKRDRYGRIVGEGARLRRGREPRAGQARPRVALSRVRERADAGRPDRLRRHRVRGADRWSRPVGRSATGAAVGVAKAKQGQLRSADFRGRSPVQPYAPDRPSRSLTRSVKRVTS
jgi:hypothetical protein